MKYLDKKFSVSSPGTQAYADAWDRIFGCRHPVRQAHATGADCVCGDCGETVPCSAEPVAP